MTSIIPITG